MNSVGFSPKEIINGFLGDFGERIGLPLSLDENNACTLEIDHRLRCTIEIPEKGAVVHLHSPMKPLSDVADDEREGLFSWLLRLNFLCLETRGATFSIDERKNEIILSFSRPITEIRDSAAFANMLAGFIETALRWRDELNAFGSKGTGGEGGSGSDPDGPGERGERPAGARFWV